MDDPDIPLRVNPGPLHEDCPVRCSLCAATGAALAVVTVAVLAVFAFMAFASPAYPHDWYIGQKNDKGQGCCSGRDCAPIPAETVRCAVDRCEVSLAPGQHPEAPEGGRFIFVGVPKSSPDWQSHACIYWPGTEQANTPDGFDGTIRCLWTGGAM